jgi:7-cyano-7-deazaguanine synthase in queuosine biosynthesis
MMAHKIKPINLLWSGGWDSTFRLLQILLLEKKPIRPFYIIDPSRKSLSLEFCAMSEIKKILKAEHPETNALLSQTEFYNKIDIKYNEAFQDARSNYIGEYALKSQDGWFIYLSHHLDIDDFEFCMEKQEYTEGTFRQLILADSTGKGHDRRLRKNLNDKELVGYQRMRFPLINTTKRDMEKIAGEKGFLHILKKSWFCHFPKFGYPCGICFPCKLIMLNKLYDRIPWPMRWRYHLLHALKKL